MKKFIVAFAGPAGSSKTPIANYLSGQFGLPVFNTDAIRAEMTEDFLSYDRDQYKTFKNKRFRKIVDKGNSFILDASIDREWETYKKIIDGEYAVFIISIDISEKFLRDLYKAKIYQATQDIDKWMEDHRKFLEKYGKLVNLSINDNNFKNRLALSAEALEKWIKE